MSTKLIQNEVSNSRLKDAADKAAVKTCGHARILRTRSSDNPDQTICQCADCKHTWTENS